MSAVDRAQWEAVLRKGVRANRLIPAAVAVGGTVAALYAGHRISGDVHYLVRGLREHFDDALYSLEQDAAWRANRIQRPVLILGTLGDVQIGFRAPRRTTPIETTRVSISEGDLVVPTLDAILGIKAFLAYSRNALRDYLDYAALTTLADEQRVLSVLVRLDEQDRGLQQSSVCLEVAKSLSSAQPYDLET